MINRTDEAAEDNSVVKQLKGTEGGQWQVRTRRSEYLFDLDNQTVTRVPGALAGETINDGCRALRAIETCEVGKSGYWTMFAGGYTDPIDYYWQISSEIMSIERMSAI